MVLLTHVLIALSSVGYTTYVFFSPSKSKLRVSYALVALTLVSGTYLAVTNPSHMLEVCTVGLLYTGIVSFGLVSVHNKLTTAKNTDKTR